MNDVANSQSHTPRTDEHAIESLVHIDFARTLELELSDAITRIAAAEANAKCAWQTAANSDKAYQAEYAKRKEAEATVAALRAKLDRNDKEWARLYDMALRSEQDIQAKLSAIWKREAIAEVHDDKPHWTKYAAQIDTPNGTKLIIQPTEGE